VIGVIVPAVRLEREDHLRPDVGDDAANRRLDVEHVDVGQRMRVVVPLPVLPRRVVKTEQHRRLETEPFAGHTQLLHAERAQICDRAERRMRLARLTVGGTDERDAHAVFAQVRQHACVKDLVVRMREDDEQRRTCRLRAVGASASQA